MERKCKHCGKAIPDHEAVSIGRVEAEACFDCMVARHASVDELERRNARLVAALERIDDWAKAYPLKVFPEPDFKKVAAVLKEHGMTLDAISASNMRHVVKGVAEIARAALKENGGTDAD